MSRRDHNEQHLRTFLNKTYPMQFQGRPDPELVFDKTKPGSSVLLKRSAEDRADAKLSRRNHEKPGHMRVRVEKDGEMVEPDPAEEESFTRCHRLLSDGASKIGPLHRLASNLVLLNPNTAGGWVEMERLEASPDKAGRDIGAMCRTVVGRALDALERDGYWLNVGTDETWRSKREEWEAKRGEKRKNDAQNAYRIIHAAWKEWQKENQRVVVVGKNPKTGEPLKRRDPTTMSAKEMFRAEYSEERKYDLTPWKLDQAIRFCEGRDTSVRPEEGVWRDLNREEGTDGDAA